MKLGLFMMPLHDPKRAYMEVLKQDREAILLADQLGYNEAWVGEHYSYKTEPIPSQLQFNQEEPTDGRDHSRRCDQPTAWNSATCLRERLRSNSRRMLAPRAWRLGRRQRRH